MSIAPALFLLRNTVTVVSTLWVVLVAFDVLGTVWLVVGPAMVGAAEIVASHWRYGRGRPGRGR